MAQADSARAALDLDTVRTFLVRAFDGLEQEPERHVWAGREDVIIYFGLEDRRRWSKPLMRFSSFAMEQSKSSEGSLLTRSPIRTPPRAGLGPSLPGADVGNRMGGGDSFAGILIAEGEVIG